MGGGGSSGVHAMDGQSGDGAREGETLGKGSSHSESEALGTGGSHPESDALGKGGSDGHSDKSDDLSSVAGGISPSDARSEASSVEGDPSAADIGGDEGPMRYEPVHEVDGDWDDQTPVGGKPGAWGIRCGNWGGQWHDETLHKHMGFDLKSSAGTILLLQEATEELLQHLKKPRGLRHEQGVSADPW